MSPGEPLPGELERLREESAALNEQVKHLVQVEQRLYRSQNELNRQLQNMRDLAAFALSCSGSDDSRTILERACRVLSGAFSMDWIAALRLEYSERRFEVEFQNSPAPPGEPGQISEDELAWISGLPHLARVDLPGSPGCAGSAFAVRLWPRDRPAPEERPGSLLLMSLRNGAGIPAYLLMAFSSARQRALYWPEDLSDRNLPFLEVFSNHLQRALENSRLTADLRERSSELSLSVEELERTQARLVQAQKMEAIGRLAGGVAHDFNNLLTVILGHAALLRESIEPGSAQGKDVERVIAAGERAAAITRQLLTVGRRQAQRREAMDLNRLARAVGEMLERLIGEHIQLSLTLDPGEMVIWADPSQMEQVVLNLVVNARDALPSGGKIRVRTRAAGPEDRVRCACEADARPLVALEVQDDGVGMDEATRQRIFEPFYSTKEVGRGTGLGLAVVYGILQQTEGYISVDTSQGSGTRFLLLLPRCPASGIPQASPSPVARARHASQGLILLVEDEEMIRGIAREFLEQAGYRVREAPNGKEALRILREEHLHPQVLLTDVVMPEMGGLELADHALALQPGLSVAYMSGYAREQEEWNAGDDPTAGRRFLAKPFSREQLVELVGEALESVENGNGSGDPGRRPGDSAES